MQKKTPFNPVLRSSLTMSIQIKASDQRTRLLVSMLTCRLRGKTSPATVISPLKPSGLASTQSVSVVLLSLALGAKALCLGSRAIATFRFQVLLVKPGANPSGTKTLKTEISNSTQKQKNKCVTRTPRRYKVTLLSRYPMPNQF